MKSAAKNTKTAAKAPAKAAAVKPASVARTASEKRDVKKVKTFLAGKSGPLALPKAPKAKADKGDDTKRTARNKVIVQQLEEASGAKMLVVYDRKARRMGWVEAVDGKFDFLKGRKVIQMVAAQVPSLAPHKTGEHLENVAAGQA